MIMRLAKYPVHKLPGLWKRTGHRLWAWGVCLHAGGDSGLVIAWIKRDKPQPPHGAEEVGG